MADWKQQREVFLERMRRRNTELCIASSIERRKAREREREQAEEEAQYLPYVEPTPLVEGGLETQGRSAPQQGTEEVVSVDHTVPVCEVCGDLEAGDKTCVWCSRRVVTGVSK